MSLQDRAFSVRARGTVRVIDPLTLTPKLLVYQRTKAGLGNVADDPTRSLQVRAHVIPPNPRSFVQQVPRIDLARATFDWQALSEPMREEWEAPALRRRITAYMAFVSAQVKAARLARGLQWDGGKSLWDQSAVLPGNPGAPLWLPPLRLWTYSTAVWE